VVVKKDVKRLQDAGIVEMDDQGKIHIKNFEVE
jgi:hypothetical protein